MAQLKREFKKPVIKKADKGIVPGEYPAKIIALGTPEGFNEGDDSAMFVRYEIDMNGSKVVKDESFFLGNFENPRLERLDNFLLSEGCKSYDDAIGKSVLLTFAYEVKHGRKFCNIVRYAHVENVEEQAKEAC